MERGVAAARPVARAVAAGGGEALVAWYGMAHSRDGARLSPVCGPAGPMEELRLEPKLFFLSPDDLEPNIVRGHRGRSRSQGGGRGRERVDSQARWSLFALKG